MSRGYSIRWRTQTVTRVTERGSVTAADRLELAVDLLGILSEGEMTALLRDALCADGWTPAGDGELVQVIDGVEARLAKDGRSIRMGVEGSRDVRGVGDDRDEAVRALARSEERAQAALSSELARRLDRAEADLQGRLAEVIQGVYVEALKQKAARLGEVSSIDERMDEQGQLELTIKVKV